MNKIAAYKVALQLDEQEKRAEYITRTFGTSDGQMPEAYLRAFDSLIAKEAGLSAVGRGLAAVGTGVGQLAGRAGAALSAAPAGSMRSTLGGALSRASQGVAANSDTAALVGAGTLGAGAAGVGGVGTGYLMGRPSSGQVRSPTG